MAYYKNNRNHSRNNSRPSRGQNYVWVVYNWKQNRNHTFASKVEALKYYYNHQFNCSSPDKREG